MIVSLHKALYPGSPNRARGFCATLLTIGLGAFAAGPLYGFQETEESQQEAVSQQTSADQAQEVRQAKKQAEDRFFLGPRFQFKRQVGPALGQPRSILPQPYVPAGAIQVPPVPNGTTMETPREPIDGVQTAHAQPSEGAVELSSENIDDEASSQEEQGILEGLLQTIDPSGVAVLADSDGYSRDFWGSSDRASIVQKIRAFAKPTASIAMSETARKVALSGFVLAAPENDGDISSFVGTRLQILAAHGDTQGYLALLSRLAADHDWSDLAQQIANGHLIAGRIEDACALAAVERTDSNDAYWLRLATFCRAVQGDRVGVDFHLGILEEVSAIQPTFYQLTDQILVEAEQAQGAVLSEGMILGAPLKVNVLEATMARLAKAQVPELDTSFVDPLAAKAMLGIPSIAPAAKLQLISSGLSQGWLGSDMLVGYLRSAGSLREELEFDLQGLIEADDSFDADVMLLGLAMGSTDELVQSDALAALQMRMADPDKAYYLLPALNLILSQQTEEADARARHMRIALFAGDTQSVADQFISLRAARAGDDAKVDQMLQATWPLMVASGMEGAPAVTSERLAAWWALQSNDERRFEKASLLFTVLEALGHSVSEDVWALAEAGEIFTDGPSVSPALWRRLLVMKSEGDRAGVLSLAYRMTSEQTVSASFAGSLIGVLREFEFHDEAHRLATELILRWGL